MSSLDRIDRLILQRLLGDGRASFSAIARETKLTDVAIKKRFERLKRQGIIRSISADLDYDVLGFGKPIYALLKTDAGKIKQVTKRMSELEYVVELYHIIGDNTFLVKLIIPDLSTAKRYLEDLGLMDGVREIRSMMVLSEIKKTNALPSAPFQKKLFQSSS